MPFREQELVALCAICSKPGIACATCEAPHCEPHRLEGRCLSCYSKLWQLERRRLHQVGIVGGLVGGAAMLGTGLMMLGGGFVSFLGFCGFGVLAGLSYTFNKVVPGMLRRSVERRHLRPGSTKLLPQPKGEQTTSNPQRQPKKRARGLQRKPRNWVGFDRKL